MTKEANDCVCCDWCADCGAKHRTVTVCDSCENEGTIYSIEEHELCMDCIDKYIKDCCIDDILSDMHDEILEYLGVGEVEV